jgi:hypothetical protein
MEESVYESFDDFTGNFSYSEGQQSSSSSAQVYGRHDQTQKIISLTVVLTDNRLDHITLQFRSNRPKEFEILDVIAASSVISLVDGDNVRRDIPN